MGLRVTDEKVIKVVEEVMINFNKEIICALEKKMCKARSITIRENNVIGNSVSIGSHTVIEHDVIVEDNVRIHSQAFIPEYSILKKCSWIGPNSVLTNAKYPLSQKCLVQQGRLLQLRVFQSMYSRETFQRLLLEQNLQLYHKFFL